MTTTDAYVELYQKRKTDLINHINKTGRKYTQPELTELWGLTKAGVNSYINHNHLESYVLKDSSHIKRNIEKPEDVTNYLLALKSKLGVLYPIDMTGHELHYTDLLPEQQALFIPSKQHQQALNINNNMRLMQTFTDLYGHKPNSNDVYFLTQYTSFAGFRVHENRNNYPYTNYYDSTPESEPPTEMLSDDDLQIITEIAQLTLIEP